MTDLMEPVLDRIEDALAGATGTVTLRWGTVTAADPLRVRLDADADPIPFKPATAVPDLAEGERVLCALQHRRIILVNVAGRSYLTEAALRELGPLNRSGTAAERAATTARHGDLWYDTDADRIVWKGASDGRWRQRSGRASDIARAWGTTSGTQAGRTITFSLPTWLEDHEDIAISSRTVGSGYGLVSLNAVTTDPITETTAITVRFMQILSTATQPCVITWWIEDRGL